MAKNNKSTINDWSNAIAKSWDRQREIDEKLTPSKGQMRYVTDFARNIDKVAQLMNNASEMAHQSIIDFDIAQKIMDTQKKNILKDIEYLKSYLEDNAN